MASSNPTQQKVQLPKKKKKVKNPADLKVLVTPAQVGRHVSKPHYPHYSRILAPAVDRLQRKVQKTPIDDEVVISPYDLKVREAADEGVLVNPELEQATLLHKITATTPFSILAKNICTQTQYDKKEGKMLRFHVVVPEEVRKKQGTTEKLWIDPDGILADFRGAAFVFENPTQHPIVCRYRVRLAALATPTKARFINQFGSVDLAPHSSLRVQFKYHDSANMMGPIMAQNTVGTGDAAHLRTFLELGEMIFIFPNINEMTGAAFNDEAVGVKVTPVSMMNTINSDLESEDASVAVFYDDCGRHVLQLWDAARFYDMPEASVGSILVTDKYYLNTFENTEGKQMLVVTNKKEPQEGDDFGLEIPRAWEGRKFKVTGFSGVPVKGGLNTDIFQASFISGRMMGFLCDLSGRRATFSFNPEIKGYPLSTQSTRLELIEDDELLALQASWSQIFKAASRVLSYGASVASIIASLL